jgi:predicted nucleic acid-binding protein
MNVVVDASVIVKWFVPEVRDELARSWLVSDVRFSAPELVVIETANVLSNKVREGWIDRNQLEAALSSIRSGRIAIVPDSALLDRAVGLSLEIRHAVYDCVYLALAEEQGSSLVSDDSRFCSKASSAGYASLIADFRAGPPEFGRG